MWRGLALLIAGPGQQKPWRERGRSWQPSCLLMKGLSFAAQHPSQLRVSPAGLAEGSQLCRDAAFRAARC